MSKPTDRAEELQLDACLAEASGVEPSDDLMERTLAAVRDESSEHRDDPAIGTKPRWLLAAGLASFGLAVVTAVVLLQPDDRSAASQQEEGTDAAPQEIDGQDPDSQDPEPTPKKQDPENPLQDPKADDIARWIRHLEIDGKRADALRLLVTAGERRLHLARDNTELFMVFLEMQFFWALPG